MERIKLQKPLKWWWYPLPLMPSTTTTQYSSCCTSKSLWDVWKTHNLFTWKAVIQQFLKANIIQNIPMQLAFRDLKPSFSINVITWLNVTITWKLTGKMHFQIWLNICINLRRIVNRRRTVKYKHSHQSADSLQWCHVPVQQQVLLGKTFN